MRPRLSFVLPIFYPLILVSTALAISFDNPYQGIVERNVFALKDPPPPPPPPGSDSKPSGPPITLTGITTILGTKRAFMTLQMPGKPPEPAKPLSLMLTIGQRDGDIEVLEIDEKAGAVKINAFGAITNLTFDKNGVKGASPSSGSPNPTGGIPAPATAAPSNPFAPTPGVEQKSIPTRMLRLPGTQPGAAPGQSTGTPTPQPAPGTSPFGTAFATPQPDSGAPQTFTSSGRSPEENVLLYEANRLKNEQLRQQGYNLPKLPVHPAVRGEDQEGNPQPTTTPNQPRLPFAPTIPRQLAPQ